jgi:hypothetical protein
VASDCDRTDEGPWDALEQGFFAAAPPDVPEPPAEPMRFDDLDPVVPAGRQTRAAAWRASAAASAGKAWRKLAPAKASAAAAWRRLAPGVAAAAVVSRRSARHVAAAARFAARAGQAQVPRVLAVFRNSSRQVRILAAGAAALIAVTGVSAGVVASRGNGRALPVAARASSPSMIASGLIAPPTHPAVSLAPAPAVAMTVAPDQDPLPASAAIAPAPRKRKHAKAPARQVVRAKPVVGKAAPARPTSR